MGKLPSGFFAKSIGRLIDGCEASDITVDTSDAYKNGSDNSAKSRVWRYAKIRNKTNAFSPIRVDMPKKPMSWFVN